MAQQVAPPMCTIVWPEIPWIDDAWIVGWNPRGLVLVVAAFVSAPTVLDAQKILRERLLQADCRSKTTIRRNLRIIGRLRTGNDVGDGGARAARTAADIWIELVRGPALADLYCCGYKHRAQLHVIRCDPRCRRFQCTSTNISVLSHWGISGIAALLAGGKPLLSSEAESSLEGPLLLPHAAQLFNRPGASGGGGSPIHTTQRAGTPPGQLDDDANVVRELSVTPSKSAGSLEKNSSANALVDDSFTSDLSSHASVDDTTGKANVAVVVPGRPPRLSFPTVADKTELSDVFACLNSGVLVRDILTSTRASSANAKTIPRKTTTANNGSFPLLSSILSLIIRVLCGIQLLVSVLSRVSYVGRVLDFRIRELVNWLSLISGRSTSCGLHPLIPHILDDSCEASQRRTCLLGFATRVLSDVLLGLAIAGLLVVWEPRAVALVKSLGWFGLYDLHMGYISWFVGWPAGFKMNDDLNVVLSFVTRSVLRSWRDVVTHEIFQDRDVVGQAFRLWIVVSCFGASFAFAFVADCSNIVTQHLRWSFHFMSAIYQCFHALLSCLLLMFRGRKFNPLRKRIDGADFSVDQMLFGALLTTATMFLFPTLALYYFYLAVVRMSIWLVQEALSALSYICCYLPVFPVLQWVLLRKVLPSGVELEQPTLRAPPSAVASPSSPTSLSPSAQLPTIDITLKIKPMPIAAAFVDVCVVAWLVSRPFAIPRLLSFVVNADNKPLVSASTNVFPHLAACSRSPPLTVGGGSPNCY